MYGKDNGLRERKEYLRIKIEKEKYKILILKIIKKKNNLWKDRMETLDVRNTHINRITKFVLK